MSECHNLIISHNIIMNVIMSISINKHVLEPDDSLYYSYMVAVSTFAWPCLNWGDAGIQGIVIEARSYCYGMFVKEHSEGVPQIGLVTCDEMVFQLRDEYFGETCLVSLLMIARTTFRINTSQWCCPHFSCQCCISDISGCHAAVLWPGADCPFQTRQDEDLLGLEYEFLTFPFQAPEDGYCRHFHW